MKHKVSYAKFPITIFLLSSFLGSCGHTPTPESTTKLSEQSTGISEHQKLLVSSSSDKQVKLVWKKPAQGNVIAIERKSIKGSFQKIANLSANSTSFIDKNVDPNTFYVYRLRIDTPQNTNIFLEREMATPAPGQQEVYQTFDTPSTYSTKANFNKYIIGLPTWSKFSPPLADQKIVGNTTKSSFVEDNVNYSCSKTPISLTRTPDKVVTFEPTSDILWTGGLVQGQSYLQGISSLKELPIRQRAPLKISVDLLSSDNARTVHNPDKASVSQAIGGMIEKAQENAVDVGTNVIYSKHSLSNSRELALSLGLSSKFWGNEVNALFSKYKSKEYNTVTAFFVEKAFTVSAVSPQTPADYFSDSFTENHLLDQISFDNIGKNNPPAYTAKITYGRILMFSVTAKEDYAGIEKLIDALSKGVTEEKVDLTKRQKETLNSAKIKAVTVGGSTHNITELIKTGSLSAYFEQPNSLTAYRPISYTIRDLRNGNVTKVSEKVDYDLSECVANKVIEEPKAAKPDNF